VSAAGKPAPARRQQAGPSPATFARLLRDEPELARLHDWAVAAQRSLLDLAIDKVVAHRDDPGAAPLPADPRSLETVLDRLYATASNRHRRRVADAIRPRLAASARAARYGGLAAVDPRSPVPVVEQARPLLPAGMPRLSAETGRRVARAMAARPVPAATAPGRLVLRLDSVECREKTLEAFEGRDEIAIQAIGFDQASILAADAAFNTVSDIGRFRDGETIATGGRELGAFAIDPAAAGAQGFRVLLFLDELDRAVARTAAADAVLVAAIYTIVGVTVSAMAILTAGTGSGLVMALAGGGVPFIHQVKSFVQDEAFPEATVFAFVENGVPPVLAPSTVPFQLSEGILGTTRRRGRYEAAVRFVVE